MAIVSLDVACFRSFPSKYSYLNEIVILGDWSFDWKSACTLILCFFAAPASSFGMYMVFEEELMEIPSPVSRDTTTFSAAVTLLVLVISISRSNTWPAVTFSPYE